jgi:hypothetical protein
MLREATVPPAAVNVLDVSSESMAAFQVFLYGRFWVFTEGIDPCVRTSRRLAPVDVVPLHLRSPRTPGETHVGRSTRTSQRLGFDGFRGIAGKR